MLTPDFRSGEACAPSTDASVPKRVLGPLVCQKGQRRRSLSRPWMGKAVVVFQSLSHVRLFVTLWIAARQATLSFAVSWSLLRFISVESVVLSNQLILCCPLLLLPSIFASIRVFSNESALHIRWPKYWSFSLHKTGVPCLSATFLSPLLFLPPYSSFNLCFTEERNQEMWTSLKHVETQERMDQNIKLMS